MTIAQLIKDLEKYPPNMDVFMGERDGDFEYEPVNRVFVDKVRFYDDSDENNVLEAYDDVVILSEV